VEGGEKLGNVAVANQIGGLRAREEAKEEKRRWHKAGGGGCQNKEKAG